MSKARIVGSGELKTRLGHYLRRVRHGETILVTDRHELVAELRPVPGMRDATAAVLWKLASAGVVTLPSRRTATRFAPIHARGAGASVAVAADRSERV